MTSQVYIVRYGTRTMYTYSTSTTCIVLDEFTNTGTYGIICISAKIFISTFVTITGRCWTGYI
jgi:PKD repeat protein